MYPAGAAQRVPAGELWAAGRIYSLWKILRIWVAVWMNPFFAYPL